MSKIQYIFVTFMAGIILIGCQNLNLSNDVTTIEVYEWDSETLVTKIDDQAFIAELVKKLEHAETSSTATMDFAMPDYTLLFKHNEDVVYEIGYYKRVMNLGIEGRYWEFDQIYGVTQKLPID